MKIIGTFLVVVELWISNPSPSPPAPTHTLMLAAVIELRESKNKRHHTGGDTDWKDSSSSGQERESNVGVHENNKKI